jgi:hypothetical protein
MAQAGAPERGNSNPYCNSRSIFGRSPTDFRLRSSTTTCFRGFDDWKKTVTMTDWRVISEASQRALTRCP